MRDESHARQQVTEDEVQRAEQAAAAAPPIVLPVGGRRRGAAARVRSPFRCDARRDSGQTHGSYAGQRYFCVNFARGCCTKGAECAHLHRLPDADDDAYYLHLDWDIFGRPRTLTATAVSRQVPRDSLGYRSLFVGYEGAAALELPTLRKMLESDFGEWGLLDNIHIVQSKGIAFVRYKLRAAAEFAKEAMHLQGLYGSTMLEVLNVQWSTNVPTLAANKKRPQPDGVSEAVETSWGGMSEEQQQARIAELQMRAALKSKRVIGAYPRTDHQFDDPQATAPADDNYDGGDDPDWVLPAEAAIDEHNANEQPADHVPADDRPADEQPADEEREDEQPAGGSCAQQQQQEQQQQPLSPHDEGGATALGVEGGPSALTSSHFSEEDVEQTSGQPAVTSVQYSTAHRHSDVGPSRAPIGYGASVTPLVPTGYGAAPVPPTVAAPPTGYGYQPPKQPVSCELHTLGTAWGDRRAAATAAEAAATAAVWGYETWGYWGHHFVMCWVPPVAADDEPHQREPAGVDVYEALISELQQSEPCLASIVHPAAPDAAAAAVVVSTVSGPDDFMEDDLQGGFPPVDGCGGHASTTGEHTGDVDQAIAHSTVWGSDTSRRTPGGGKGAGVQGHVSGELGHQVVGATGGTEEEGEVGGLALLAAYGSGEDEDEAN